MIMITIITTMIIIIIIVVTIMIIVGSAANIQTTGLTARALASRRTPRAMPYPPVSLAVEFGVSLAPFLRGFPSGGIRDQSGSISPRISQRWNSG